MMRGRGRGKAFSQPVAKPKTVAPEQSMWFWNPNQPAARPAPEWFQARLREVDPDRLIDIRWNPIRERWVAFYKNNKIQSTMCAGWMVLFVIEEPGNKAYMPLDERTLATLYAASAQKWGNGREYFLAIERELERDRERTERNNRQESIDLAMPAFEHSQISVSMAGKSNGSKFSTYHS